MKIVIIHPKASIRNSLIEWLEKKRGHAVLAHGDWPADLRATVAEFEPDLVLLPPAPAAKNTAVPSDLFVPLTFPECPFENLPDGPLFTDEIIDEKPREPLLCPFQGSSPHRSPASV